jgi:hypothetical protein
LFYLNCYKVTASTESGVHDISHWNLLTEFSQGRYVYLVVFFSCQIGCGNYSWYFQYVLSLFEEMFEDTKGVIRNRSVTDNVMAKRKKDKHDRKYTTRKGFRKTRTPLTTGVECMLSGRVGSSCSTRGTNHVTLVTNPVTSHEWGKDHIMITTNWTYPWSYVTQILQLIIVGLRCRYKSF